MGFILFIAPLIMIVWISPAYESISDEATSTLYPNYPRLKLLTEKDAGNQGIDGEEWSSQRPDEWA
jgi:hypothetical protein